MLHHLAGATIQVANLVSYYCHPQEDGNNCVQRESTAIGYYLGQDMRSICLNMLRMRSILQLFDYIYITVCLYI